MSIVDAATGKIGAYAPRIGDGVADASVSGSSLWVAASRSNQVVRLNAKTGRPIGDPIEVPFRVNSIAATPTAVWAGLVPGNDAPDLLVKIDPRTGHVGPPVSYPYGIQAMTTSPTALWVTSRRRALVERVDPTTGAIEKSFRVGNSRSEDIVYRRGSLWAATPGDDTVYKINTSTADAIPIGVGHFPRQLVVTDDTVYVTNYNSSDLTMIDAKTSRVLDPSLPLSVNPYSLAVDESGKTVWVGSVPENRLTEIATGRGG
jgi:DNA-binding beta-propeller fold protein YncE